MALQFIAGNSGSGKTWYVFDKLIKQADANPKKNYLCIVPEQFTMETQRRLVLMQKNHSITNIDVLSFQRLAYRVFDELGDFCYQVLEETGKNLILRKVAEEKSRELTVLKKNITKMGYIGEVKSLISELSQYNVTPGQLTDAVEKLPEGSFSYKLQDVLTMYQGFLDYLEGRFVTAEEVLELLIDAADRSAILKDSCIVFDGFTGFTPIQNQLLEKLMGLAEHIWITVTIDSRENFYHCSGDHELFAMSKKMMHTLLEMATKRHIAVEDTIVLEHGENSRFRESQALYFLEQNLFRRERACGKLGEGQDICIHSLQNPREEMDFAAREILRLVRKEGYRYRDIAIVCGDLPGYANYAKEIFGIYDIPLFTDQKTTILYHPLIEFLRAVPEVIRQDFSNESIFRYLRSGLSGICREETDILENYCLAAGIRGYRQWKERFCYLPKDCTEEELEEINEIRSRVAEQFEKLRETFLDPESSVRQKTMAFYEFICQRDVQRQLEQRQKAYEAADDLKNAREYAQIYRIVMDLLDKLVELLGDEKIPLDEYAKILDAGYEAAKVGIIPPGYDRIVLGDIERTRLDHIKILFFVGVNDGVIPKSGGSDGILSQTEREQLEEMQLELAPTMRKKTFIQKFYLYLNLTKPGHRLYLSYARVDGEGKAMRSSYLIHTILSMYEDLEVRHVENESYRQRIVTPENSLSLIVEGIQQSPQWSRDNKEENMHLWASLCRWYESREEWKERAEKLVTAAQYQHADTPISSAVTRALYGTVLENSVTRLETFAACAFSHFLSYGLGLHERQISSFSAADIGTVLHEVLELYAIAMQKSGSSWFDITREQSETLLQEAMDQAIGKNHNLALYENARSRYTRERLHRILKRTIWALTCQVRKGHFAPDGFEISFSHAEDMKSVNFKLSEEEKMHLRGRIDRIDTYQQEQKLYVKVIDYKSGNTAFQFLNVYYGLQLQLVVYMNAAVELMEKRHPDTEVIPAGIFYYHMKDPMVEAEGELSEEELQQKILGELKLNGVVNEDRLILESMDTSLEDAADVMSSVIPVGINKNGTLKKASKTMGTAEFQALSSHVNQTIQKLGERIMQGDISVSPYALLGKTGCDYCEYRAVCQFDAKIPGYAYRRLEELSEEELKERMRGEEGS